MKILEKVIGAEGASEVVLLRLNIHADAGEGYKPFCYNFYVVNSQFRPVKHKVLDQNPFQYLHTFQYRQKHESNSRRRQN